MIVCPNCNHQNPDGAVQCEACYTPLPATTNCPNCGTTVQTDASFCGQCGFNLQNNATGKSEAQAVAPATVAMASSPQVSMPNLDAPDPLVELDPLPMSAALPIPTNASEQPVGNESSSPSPSFSSSQAEAAPASLTPPPSPPPPPPPPPPPAQEYGSSQTRIQQQTAKLLHVQTKTEIELPQNLPLIHLGKPNDQIPPDIDVSGFPNSEVVSRVHADIRVEGDAFYLEDVGSSNGTYINHTALPPGNRHRLRPGDRISLGKGDLVTFLFQVS